jgi:hypothetical protein
MYMMRSVAIQLSSLVCLYQPVQCYCNIQCYGCCGFPPAVNSQGGRNERILEAALNLNLKIIK